jgi:hypothetical protein
LLLTNLLLDLLACAGGFGSYLFGMSPNIAKQAGTANDVKSLGLGWMIAFLFVVSFLGLFSVVPLRKVQYYQIINTLSYLNKINLTRPCSINLKQLNMTWKRRCCDV